MESNTNHKHIWHFFRTCGLEQVILRKGDDVANLPELDQKLWTALSCPVTGVHFDNKTLDSLDQDSNGRIRVPELMAALQWLKARLVSLDALVAGSDTIELANFNQDTPEGAALLENAKSILSNLGKPEATAISLADATDTAKIFAETRFNGDGIITSVSAADEILGAVIDEIIALFGSEEDRSGKPGVSELQVDAYFTAIKERLAWLTTAAQDTSIMVLQDETAAAATATSSVSAKIDDYFTRCRMAAFDARASQTLNRHEDDLAALAAQELSIQDPALAAFPLAQTGAERALPLAVGVNPYWADALAEFRRAAVVPLLGELDELTLEQWRSVQTALAPYNAWMAAEAGAEVSGLSQERLQALTAGKEAAQLKELLAQDLALAPQNAKIVEVETLLRYHANLSTLLDNYVNMSQLYDPKRSAIFQMGTLYMDARACDLCFHVEDIAAHAEMAEASKCCLIYCTLTRSGSDETRTICAAMTAGFANTLWVGRNGIFYDRDGVDWDATIVKIIDNAISLREAFWSPWRKIATMISAQVNKLLAARQDAVLASTSARIEGMGTAEAAAEAPKKMEGAALASSVAALGIAIGLIGSAVGGLVGVIAGLPLWKVAAGLLVVLLLVSGPSVILTAFKLRARDLAPILNACGWAVNRRLRISLKLGRLFTQEARVPQGAVRELRDPYADSHTLRNTIIILVLAGALLAFWLYAGRVTRSEVVTTEAAEVSTDAADVSADTTGESED